MNEKQLAKLIKQAAAKADAKAKTKPKNFDATLTHTRAENVRRTVGDDGVDACVQT